MASKVDLEEARAIGQFAVRKSLEERSDKSAVIKAQRKPRYISEFDVVELGMVAGKKQAMPLEYVEDNVITQDFRDYALPLVGELPRFKMLI